MVYEQWLSQFTDWRPATQAWQSFSIADTISETEINCVYRRLFKEMKDDYKTLTELVMVLNHKMFQHKEIPGHRRLSELYANLFESADSYALKVLKDDELSYFLSVTD